MTGSIATHKLGCALAAKHPPTKPTAATQCGAQHISPYESVQSCATETNLKSYRILMSPSPKRKRFMTVETGRSFLVRHPILSHVHVHVHSGSAYSTTKCWNVLFYRLEVWLVCRARIDARPFFCRPTKLPNSPIDPTGRSLDQTATPNESEQKKRTQRAMRHIIKPTERYKSRSQYLGSRK